MTLSSKVSRGKTILETAQERYQDKTGLLCNFTILGTLRKIVFDPNQKLLDDCFYQVVFADSYTGTFLEQPEHEMNLWLTFKEAKAHEQTNRSSGDKTQEILHRLENHNYAPFFFEENIITEKL